MPGLMLVPTDAERAALAERMSKAIWRLDPIDEPIPAEIDARVVAGLLHERDRLQSALNEANEAWISFCASGGATKLRLAFGDKFDALIMLSRGSSTIANGQ